MSEVSMFRVPVESANGEPIIIEISAHNNTDAIHEALRRVFREHHWRPCWVREDAVEAISEEEKAS